MRALLVSLFITFLLLLSSPAAAVCGTPAPAAADGVAVDLCVDPPTNVPAQFVDHEYRWYTQADLTTPFAITTDPEVSYTCGTSYVETRIHVTYVGIEADLSESEGDLNDPSEIIYCGANSDFNGDLAVDGADYQIFLADYEHGSDPNGNGTDLNDDTAVDGEDFWLFRKTFAGDIIQFYP